MFTFSMLGPFTRASPLMQLKKLNVTVRRFVSICLPLDACSKRSEGQFDLRSLEPTEFGQFRRRAVWPPRENESAPTVQTSAQHSKLSLAQLSTSLVRN